MSDNFNLNYIWQFRFETFLEAYSLQNSKNQENSEVKTGGFESKEWKSRQIEMLNLALKAKLPRSTTIAEFLATQRYTNLIDFWGGPGWIWAWLVKSNLQGNLNYLNLELESSRLAFEYLEQTLPRMKYIKFDDLSCISKAKNMLYANSILQYFENNTHLLKVINATNPITIVLDDVAGSNEDFFSLQNYYGYFQVNRFLSIDRLIEEISELGYQLILCRPYEKYFSPKMSPRIWLGQEGRPDCDIPESLTLVFEKFES